MSSYIKTKEKGRHFNKEEETLLDNRPPQKKNIKINPHAYTHNKKKEKKKYLDPSLLNTS